MEIPNQSGSLSTEGIIAQLRIISYLMKVAANTQGAEVWRALFAEIAEKLNNELKR